MPKIEHTVYVHRDKDSNWSEAQELGLEEDAARRFAYCGYEVAFKGHLDTDTGDFYATHVDGMALREPLRLT